MRPDRHHHFLRTTTMPPRRQRRKSKPRAINPLEIAELLDLTLSFVHDIEDLRACALVNTAWIAPSQSRIFSTIRVMHGPGTNTEANAQVARLLDILYDESPDLIRYIVNLDVGPLTFMKEKIQDDLCDLAFSHLTSLKVSSEPGWRYDMREACLIQRLVSTPSLESVFINCIFNGSLDLLLLWEQCTDRLKHVVVCSGVMFLRDALKSDFAERLNIKVPSSRIKLESFGTHDTPDVTGPWLDDFRCPFDVSAITAYQFCFPMDDFLENILSEAMTNTIELLSIRSYEMVYATNISRFLKITQLDIRGDLHGATYLDFLHTILPENRPRIKAIRFRVFQEVDIPALDKLLFDAQNDFSGLKIVEILLSQELPDLVQSARAGEYFKWMGPNITLRWSASFFSLGLCAFD
ncbi:hypothetical protein FB45DRAFT_1148850 [Roridomyces roridus]|uniref:Uncharacterized protein n=1 Tax=Roridomyces roridus TaxID=1738132 RepID=A0AAD7BXN2_9AGAR|nr:hypothetical protein FB45DRAFT_1148850 [Roridomyces roridus]